MTSSLKYYRTDPNYRRGGRNSYMVHGRTITVKRDRGPGLYYHRANGYYSKYSESRDSKIKAKDSGLHPIGLPKNNRVRHAGDGRVKRR